jgi:hypothetical protein
LIASLCIVNLTSRAHAGRISPNPRLPTIFACYYKNSYSHIVNIKFFAIERHGP